MASTNYAACLAFTLRYEGGKVDNPKDPGGRTNQGVTQATFDAWLKSRSQPPRNVYAMTVDERDAIYRDRYWRAVRADGLPAGVDLAVFDYGVNSGPARALKAWAGVATTDASGTVKKVCARRLSFLHALGTFKIFGRGWTARVAACEALGVKMAEHARIGVAPDAPAAPQAASILLAEAGRARTTGAARARGAAGLTTLGGAGSAAVAAAPAAHLPWLLIAMAAGLLVGVIALILWRARVHQIRADAYATVAAGT